jgi:NADH dehydrogenase (ubiquinone) Fe-S protein 5
VSRCFPFWQEYLACHVINQNDPEARKKGACAPVLEDYYECLHHKKEVSCLSNLCGLINFLTTQQYARAQAIQDAYRKAEAAHPRENAPKAGEIRSLGLLGKEEESKNVLKSQ